MTSVNAIDYFASLGKPKGDLILKNLPSLWEEDEVCTVSEVYNDAITDIAVIFPDKGEELPDDTWQMLDISVGGHPANCNSGDESRGCPYLAIQRRQQSHRLDHIIAIAVLQKNEAAPEGFDAIEYSISGDYAADINPSAVCTKIALKRCHPSNSQFILGQPMIDNLVMVFPNRDECVPEGYISLEKNINRGSSGEKALLAYHERAPLGICDLRYECITLDRYPQQDHGDFALPIKELPLFAFPHDLKLKYCSTHDYPLPDFFTFVFTDIMGRHYYTACLRFYETVAHEEVLKVAAELFQLDDISFAYENGMEIFAPKTVCVVSQYPFYRAMSRYLKQLYSLSLSPSFCPLEHYIISVVTQIPVPLDGGRPFHIVLDAALISETSKSMAPICLELPPPVCFPPMDVDFSGPLRCLSVENVLAVFSLMLHESKIVFLCCSNALLTEVMETFRSLLFPLLWSSTFITRLPDALCGLLQAPGGFMIGLHTAPLDTSDEKAKTKAAKLNYLTNTDWMQSLQCGTYVVDLTTNSIFQYDSQSNDRFKPIKGFFLSRICVNPLTVSNYTKILPSNAMKRLQTVLQNIATKHKLNPQTINFESFDSAFEIQSMNVESSAAEVDFPTLHVRDAFLVFMIDVIADVSKYMLPPVIDSGNNFRTFKEEFLTEDYVDDADRQVRPILEKLLATQMFSTYIQYRNEKAYFPYVLFDQCMKLLRERGYSTLNNDARSLYAIPSEKQPLQDCMYEIHQRSLLDECDFNMKVPTTSPTTALKRRRSLSQMDMSSSRHRKPKQLHSTSRNEINKCSDLHLHDASYGPIILPGPSKILLPMESPSGPQKYRYLHWPQLSEELLSQDDLVVNDRVRDMRLNRIRINEQVDSRIRLLVRPMMHRLAYQRIGKLVHQIPIAEAAETRGVISLAVDVFSVSITMLSLRAMTLLKPLQDMFQILGIISQLESMQLLGHVHEAVWRGMLLACHGIQEDEFRRKVTCVVFEAMKSAGLNPDATSFAVYAQVFQKKAKKPLLDQPCVDIFYHLQELGLTWYAQRCIPWETACYKLQQKEKHDTSWSLWGNHRRKRRDIRMLRKRSIKAKDASNDFLYNLDLARNTGFFSLRQPKCQHVYSPVFIPGMTTDSTYEELDERIQKHRKVYHKVSVQKFIEKVLAENKLILSSEDYVPSPERKIEFTLTDVTVSLPNADDKTAFNNIRLSMWLHSEEKEQIMLNTVQNQRISWKGMKVIPFGVNLALKQILFIDVIGDTHTPSYIESNVLLGQGLLDVNATLDADSHDPKSVSLFSEMGILIGEILLTCRCIVEKPSLLEIDDVTTPDGKSSILSTTPNTNESSFLPTPPRFSSPSSWKTRLSFGLFKGRASNGGRDEGLSPKGSPRGEDTIPEEPSALVTPAEVAAAHEGEFTDTSSANSESERSMSLDDRRKSSAVCPSEVITGILCDEENVVSPPSGVIADASVMENSEYNTNKAMHALQNLSLQKLSDDGDEEGDQADDGIIIDRLRSSGDSGATENNPMDQLEDIDAHPEISPHRASVCSEESSPSLHGRERRHTLAVECMQKIEDIQSAIESTVDKKQYIGIYNFTPCICGHAKLDEEIVASWSGVTNSSEDRFFHKDIYSAHRILCPHCFEEYMPQLHVRCYNESLEIVWQDDIQYLSSYGVRFLLEMLLEEEGLHVVDADWMRNHAPVVYWNMMWYAVRMNLPTGWLPHSIIDEESFNFTVTAWRPCVLEARIHRIIHEKSDIHMLQDLFPHGDESELDAACELVSALTDSHASLATVVITMHCFKSLIDHFSGSTGRRIYLTLLTLLYYCNNDVLVGHPMNLPTDFNKGTLFDRMYSEALSVAIKPEDLEAIGVSDMELLTAASSKMAQAIRIGFGFLY